MTSTRIPRSYLIAQWALLACALAGAAFCSRTSDWHPVPLVLLLGALALWGDRLNVQVRSQNLSASFIATVLTMVLLGPAPAVAEGLVMMLVDARVRRLPLALWLNNVASFTAFMLLGGLLGRLLLGDADALRPTALHHAELALAVFGVSTATNAVNFGLIAVNKRVLEGRSVLAQVRELFLPLLPSQMAAASLAAVLAVAYLGVGYAALVLLIVVTLVFQYLAIALVRSEDRAEQLATHSQRLATLQLGVLVTLVETLQLRDPTTARHAAVVARWARDLAAELGLGDVEQDQAHSAGLLHDIGKFAFPDRILGARGPLSPEDQAVVRRHPQAGATLVGRLDGYGPVADTILYHHERMDGLGYPAGLIGNEIPILARLLAVCETFDVLTAPDSYREPLTVEAALAELRRAAGTQFDRGVVEAFVTLVEREGVPDAARTRFEDELDFERRTRSLARLG